MISGLNNLGVNPAGGVGGVGGAGGAGQSGGATGTSFADVLKNSIDEVSKMQQDATQAVDNLASGQTDDVTGVMTAVEKSDLAFNTLLAIRSKLMDAYNEIKSIAV